MIPVQRAAAVGSVKHPSKLARLSVIVGAVALVGVACSSSRTDVADPPSATGVPPSATAVPPSESVAGPVPVPEVLDFSAPRLGGGAVEGSDYAGKDLAIWFWAPW